MFFALLIKDKEAVRENHIRENISEYYKSHMNLVTHTFQALRQYSSKPMKA